MARMMMIVFFVTLLSGCAGEDSSVTFPTDSYVPQPDEFIPVERPPELAYEEPPEYPLWAREMNVMGDVIVQAYVNRYGYIQKAMSVKCSRPGWGFEEAAVQAAYQCRYQPAIQNGGPVGVWVSYKVQFSY